MEKETNINEALSNLYALRAGLSVISQSADEMRDAEKKIKANIYNVMNHKWYNKNKGNYREYSVYQCRDIVENDEKKDLKKLEKLKKDLGFMTVDECTDSEEDRNLDEKERYEYITKRLSIEQNVFCEWLKTDEAEEFFTAKKNKAENDCKIFQKEISICKEIESYYNKQEKKYNCMMILTIPTIIGAIIFSSKKFKAIKLWLKNHEQLEEYSKKFQERKEELKKFQVDIQNIKTSREIIRQNDEENKPIISRVQKSTDAIYMSLQKTFNKLLDERDWKHLDLIIYYIETGRAESIKEALQLLEREIQTKRIIGAIQEATECICSTIESAAARMSAQLGVISNQLSQIASQQQVQIAQNAEIISQAKLKNALIAKSNVTSEQLMNDVKYIKTYGVKIR